MILVLDSSVLITLSRTGDLEFLQQLAGTVHIPQAVYDEVVGAGQDQRGGQTVKLAQWIVRHEVQDRDSLVRLGGRLGRGEAEAIVLARELNADFVILDDATARRIAEAEGCIVTGLLGLIVHAKERELISAVRPVLDRIISEGFYVGDNLYRTILASAGEQT